jgi:hypothetical protein
MYPEKISNLYDIFVNYFIYEYIYMFQFVHLPKEVGETETILFSEKETIADFAIEEARKK